MSYATSTISTRSSGLRRYGLLVLKRTLLTAILVASVPVLVVHESRADVLFDNFGSNDAYDTHHFRGVAAFNLPSPFLAPTYLAESFVPAGGAFTLQRIDLAICLMSGLNEFDVWLMGDDGGQPGAVLEAFHFSGKAGSCPISNLVHANSELHPALDEGERYWIVVHPSGPDPSGGGWSNGLASDFVPGWNAVRFDPPPPAPPDPWRVYQIDVCDASYGYGCERAVFRVLGDRVELNQPPTVLLGNHFGDEGEAIALSATVNDPDGDPPTYLWSYAAVSGFDTGATCLFSNPSIPTPTIACNDDGTFSLTLTVSDGVNPAVSANATLTVANVAPSIPVLGAAATDNRVDLNASISDQGSNDTHTCSVNWGDMTVSGGAVAAGRCSASHAYAEPGTFTVMTTVTDDDGGTVTASIPVTISPQALQHGLVGFLDDLAPSGDRGTDGRVNNAIKDLEQGLGDKLWLDETHLTKFGAQVFIEHKQAVEDLLKIKSPQEFVTAAIDTIASIVATDRMLVATLIADNYAGKAGEIAKANEELAKGNDDAADGKFAWAIEHYRKAWEHAYRAGP